MSDKFNNSFLHSASNETKETNNETIPSSVGGRTSGNLSKGISHPSMTGSKFVNSRMMASKSFRAELNSILKMNKQPSVSMDK